MVLGKLLLSFQRELRLPFFMSTIVVVTSVLVLES